MEILVGILAFLVATLAILQGWNMRKHNPNQVIASLNNIASFLARMEQRLNDIWDKVKGE